jgi:two-component system NtrC family sensor kinase
MRLTAIGQLAAGVAHELNNPLSVILGFSQSALRQPMADASLRTALKAIERESQRCKRLVQDLLNFSRLPKPGKVMEDPVQVVEGALSLVETQARIQHVGLIRDFASDLPALYLDRHRIQQMVINLCINAMDAMPKGGQLTVALAPAPGPDTEGAVEMRVTDTGTGIPVEIRERIFEPFFTTKESGKGTGLGLSLVRDIVKEHDGRLEVSSQQGEGTTFTVRLAADPRSKSAAAYRS